MKNKPNILFLMCDQLQKQVLEDHNPCITPTIDKLKERGMVFDRAYTPNAVCSPARASLMTGLLPHNHGVLCVTHNVDDDQAVLREEHPQWASRLQESGYYTGYFGKWHVERSCQLQQFGWEVNGELTSELYKRREEELNNGEKSNYHTVRYHELPEGYNSKQIFYGITDKDSATRPMGITTSLALDFIEDATEKDDPWCCFVSVKEPHDPFVCSKEAFDLYENIDIQLPPHIADNLDGRPNLYKKAAGVFGSYTEEEHLLARQCYYASVTEIDQHFGRIIDRVKEKGQLDNTIIVLTTDHGEMLGAHGLYCKNIGAYEEVYNIPLFISGPGIEKNAHSQAKIGLHDLAQTLLELTGNEVIDVPDSKSFACVCGNHEVYDKDYMEGFAEYFGGRIWLTQRVFWEGDWKFVFNGFDFDELYNLSEDPLELHNRIHDKEYSEEVKRLCGKMWRKIKETGDHSLYKAHYPILRVAPYGPNIVD